MRLQASGQVVETALVADLASHGSIRYVLDRIRHFVPCHVLDFILRRIWWCCRPFEAHHKWIHLDHVRMVVQKSYSSLAGDCSWQWRYMGPYRSFGHCWIKSWQLIQPSGLFHAECQ